MKIVDCKITNFKSIYGTQTFNFDELVGLIKFSGIIGSGKTSFIEAIQWGLLGQVKGQNNPALVSWNTKECEVELNLICKNKKVHIVRNICKQLLVEIDGKPISASNKNNMQTILEEEIYDIPKIAITKMCLITFNGFSSLANMNPGETKQFLDDIFGFKVFSIYNDEICNEKKNKQNELIKLEALFTEANNQIEILQEKKELQHKELETNINLAELKVERDNYVELGKELKIQYNNKNSEYESKIEVKNANRVEHYNKKLEYATLGKQEKQWYNTFSSGKCPTCGHDVEKDVIESHLNKIHEYAELYKNEEQIEKTINEEISAIKNEQSIKLNEIKEQMNVLKTNINNIDSNIKIYNNNVKLISENYDSLINEYKMKANDLSTNIKLCNNEISDWEEMNELFTKTLRYRLLNALIPHINKGIQYYINKLEQPYHIEYDQEFKVHINTDSFDKEIQYTNLSTGQKKIVDLAIIFGILQNLISNVDFNLIIMDELFSNLDADSRNTMLSVLKESLGKDKSIFVINHAEMNDDFFDHKIKVNIINKKIMSKNKSEVIVRSSKYEKIF